MQRRSKGRDAASDRYALRKAAKEAAHRVALEAIRRSAGWKIGAARVSLTRSRRREAAGLEDLPPRYKNLGYNLHTTGPAWRTRTRLGGDAGTARRTGQPRRGIGAQREVAPGPRFGIGQPRTRGVADAAGRRVWRATARHAGHRSELTRGADPRDRERTGSGGARGSARVFGIARGSDLGAAQPGSRRKDTGKSGNAGGRDPAARST